MVLFIAEQGTRLALPCFLLLHAAMQVLPAPTAAPCHHLGHRRHQLPPQFGVAKIGLALPSAILETSRTAQILARPRKIHRTQDGNKKSYFLPPVILFPPEAMYPGLCYGVFPRSDFAAGARTCTSTVVSGLGVCANARGSHTWGGGSLDRQETAPTWSLTCAKVLRCPARRRHEADQFHA